MSRRAINIPLEDNNLGDLVRGYKAGKDQEKTLKNYLNETGESIKSTMKEKGMEDYTVDDIKVTVTTTNKSTVNELQAIEILRNSLNSDQFEKVVKKREYIDDDAFEDLCYKGEADASILSPAISENEVVTLRLGKVKK